MSVWLPLLGAALCLCTWPAQGKLSECVRLPQLLLEVTRDSSGRDELRLRDDALDYIRDLPAPVFMVPILGVYRSGKSMLLNHLIGERCFVAESGDETITRGISIVGQPRAEGGTIVWMDTEGLFSSASSMSSVGLRISSMALMVSSAVMLNTLSTYDQRWRWVNFFSEQQKLAKILTSNLEGLPEEVKALMLRRQLPVFWVLSQPREKKYDHETVLMKFLKDHSWSKDLKNEAHMIPFATKGVDGVSSEAFALPDDELDASYLEEAAGLREKVLAALNSTKGMSPTVIALQLGSLMNLVENERFDPDDAAFIFEEETKEQLSSMLPCFRGTCTVAAVGQLKEELAAKRIAVDKLRSEYATKFSFDRAWVEKAKSSATRAEVGIMKDVVTTCMGYEVAWPFVPWLAGLYFRDRSKSIFFVLKRIARHVLVLVALSIIDIAACAVWLGDAASAWVTAGAAKSVEVAANVLVIMPAFFFSQAELLCLFFFYIGWCYSTCSIFRFLFYKPLRLVGSSQGLEMRLASDFVVQRHLATAAADAARSLTEGSAARAADCLFCGLVGLSEASQSAGPGSWIFKCEKSRARALKFVQEAVDNYRGRASMCAACETNQLLALTAVRQWEDLSMHMADLLLNMEAASACAQRTGHPELDVQFILLDRPLRASNGP